MKRKTLVVMVLASLLLGGCVHDPVRANNAYWGFSEAARIMDNDWQRRHSYQPRHCQSYWVGNFLQTQCF